MMKRYPVICLYWRKRGCGEVICLNWRKSGAEAEAGIRTMIFEYWRREYVLAIMNS